MNEFASVLSVVGRRSNYKPLYALWCTAKSRSKRQNKESGLFTKVLPYLLRQAVQRSRKETCYESKTLGKVWEKQMAEQSDRQNGTMSSVQFYANAQNTDGHRSYQRNTLRREAGKSASTLCQLSSIKNTFKQRLCNIFCTSIKEKMDYKLAVASEQVL